MEKKRRTIAFISALPNFGYLSVAAVYLTMGALVALVAIGVRGRAPDLREALEFLKAQPLGPLLLLGLAACAFCLAVWRLLQAVGDLEARGSHFIGLCRRAWQLTGMLIYGGLGIVILRILADAPTPSADETARVTAHKVIIHPFGWFVVFAVGLILLGGGIYYFSRALRGNFHGLFRCEEMTAKEQKTCFLLGRLGFAARGLILCVLGYLVARGGYEANPWVVGGQATALNLILAQPLGPWLLGLTALGLFAFGAFHLTVAKYGSVPEQKISSLIDKVARTDSAAD